MRRLTEAEKKFIMYQFGQASEWRELLTKLIMKSDSLSKEKLAKAYPDYVKVVDGYQNQEGYWQEIRDEWNIEHPNRQVQ